MGTILAPTFFHLNRLIPTLYQPLTFEAAAGWVETEEVTDFQYVLIDLTLDRPVAHRRPARPHLDHDLRTASLLTERDEAGADAIRRIKHNEEIRGNEVTGHHLLDVVEHGHVHANEGRADILQIVTERDIQQDQIEQGVVGFHRRSMIQRNLDGGRQFVGLHDVFRQFCDLLRGERRRKPLWRVFQDGAVRFHRRVHERWNRHHRACGGCRAIRRSPSIRLRTAHGGGSWHRSPCFSGHLQPAGCVTGEEGRALWDEDAP